MAQHHLFEEPSAGQEVPLPQVGRDLHAADRIVRIGQLLCPGEVKRSNELEQASR
jgi:hypothetical protein